MELRRYPETKASQLRLHAPAREWRLAALAGDVTELSAAGASATLTAAMRLVREAQVLGEPAAWVTGLDAVFYPPDARANGVDLAALAVVRVGGGATAIGRAADYLVRSGAFGLVVLDLDEAHGLGDRQLTRLLGLARRHETAVVCLTAKPDAAPSLGAVVSLRAGVARTHLGPGRYAWEIRALKDKRRAPGWRHTEACDGPPGLR